jgi:hypothetical protein
VCCITAEGVDVGLAVCVLLLVMLFTIFVQLSSNTVLRTG